MDPATGILAAIGWLVLRAPAAILGEYAKQWWFSTGNVRYESRIRELEAEVAEFRERFAETEKLYLKLSQSAHAAADRIEALEREKAALLRLVQVQETVRSESTERMAPRLEPEE